MVVIYGILRNYSVQPHEVNELLGILEDLVNNKSFLIPTPRRTTARSQGADGHRLSAKQKKPPA
jgi:hypothetical protein